MPAIDSTGKAALAGHFAPAWFIYLDILSDPLRVTTFGADVTFASTGDTDLDGNTFLSFGGKAIDVSDIGNGEGGSESTTITLSGIVSIDTTLVNEIGDKTKWQGRLARLWMQIYDPTGVTPQGAIVPWRTGYMSKVGFSAEPEGQTIQLTIENYLTYTTQASNRSYLNQKDYDSADTSAAATIAASNGIRAGGNGAVAGPPGAGGGGSGLSRLEELRLAHQ